MAVDMQHIQETSAAFAEGLAKQYGPDAVLRAVWIVGSIEVDGGESVYCHVAGGAADVGIPGDTTGPLLTAARQFKGHGL